MKKIFALMSIVLAVGLASCANKSQTNDSKAAPSKQEILNIEQENIELDNLDREINSDIEDIDSLLKQID